MLTMYCTLCATRMGYCLALGALPRPFLSGQLQRVLEGLVGVASNIQSSEASYTEARRDAVKAIIRSCLHG